MAAAEDFTVEINHYAVPEITATSPVRKHFDVKICLKIKSFCSQNWKEYFWFSVVYQ